MPINENIEYFPLYDLETEAEPPGMSVAVGSRVAVLGTPDAMGGSGAAAIYVYSEAENGWGYVGVFTGSKIAGSEQVRAVGSAVAVSGDTIVIGAAGDRSTPGRAFVLTPPYGAWTYAAIPVVAPLTHRGSAPGDLFGTSVSHCTDGNEHYIAVGAPGLAPPAGPFGPGQVFIYKGLAASDTPWSEQPIANPDPSGTEEDRFGASVALNFSGDGAGGSDGTLTLAVGAPGAREGQGAVYAGRTAEPGTWSGRIRFGEPLAGGPAGAFGTSVALSGGLVLAVGAPGQAGPGGEERVGSVGLFEHSGGAFAPLGERLAGSAAEAEFGRSVAFPATDPGARAGFLLIGAPGAGAGEVVRCSDTGEGFKPDQQFAALAGRPGGRFGAAVAASAFQHGTWCLGGASGAPRNRQGGGGYMFVDGEPVPKWMKAPVLIGESPLRWGGLATDWWKKYTPEIADYL
jgi:hypothetical protein